MPWFPSISAGAGSIAAAVRAAVERFLQSRGWTLIADEPDLATRLAHPRLIRLQWDGGYPRFALICRRLRAGPPSLPRQSGGGTGARHAHDGRQRAAVRDRRDSACAGDRPPHRHHDNSQHAANENLRLRNLWDGIKTYAAFLGELNW